MQRHSRPPHDNNDEFADDVSLARSAAQGHAAARKRIAQRLHPIITHQSGRFCKRFCHEQRFHYRCTVTPPWGSPPRDALYCEWGNASYGWMLEDLGNRERLSGFQGTDGASLKTYWFKIANSLPFYERWKDWRFGRRVHVPTYIQALAPEAAKVFLALQKGDEAALIAQNLGAAHDHIQQLIQRIITELAQRSRLHLLNPPVTVSLTGFGQGAAEDEGAEAQGDVPDYDEEPHVRAAREQLAAGWELLSAVEQFVLEAMVVDQQDAVDVLAALQRLNVSIIEGVPPAEIDRQQLYYFRRKALAKLAKLTGLLDE